MGLVGTGLSRQQQQQKYSLQSNTQVRWDGNQWCIPDGSSEDRWMVLLLSLEPWLLRTWGRIRGVNRMVVVRCRCSSSAGTKSQDVRLRNVQSPIAETFHEQTDDEHTKKEVKQMEADDQAIHIILMGLPEDIYRTGHKGVYGRK
ncbi:hypothetical protein Tco_0027499 [Tanacetum coccineum]